MMHRILTTRRLSATRADMRKVIMMTMGMSLLAGCIQVRAPEKPIEINLNVKIRQEVVVSLQKDVQDLDQKYPGVF